MCCCQKSMCKIKMCSSAVVPSSCFPLTLSMFFSCQLLTPAGILVVQILGLLQVKLKKLDPAVLQWKALGNVNFHCIPLPPQQSFSSSAKLTPSIIRTHIDTNKISGGGSFIHWSCA